MKIRAVGIIIKDKNVLLMHRKNIKEYIKEYFVFPGGGVEDGETVEQAVIRELKEETTLDVKINKLLYHHVYDNDTEQYFYLCDYIQGEPKLHEDSIEMKVMKDGEEYFNPLWVNIEKIKNMLVYPLEIRNWLLEDIKKNFSDPPKTVNIKISELRQKI